jgi:hypothetical protein
MLIEVASGKLILLVGFSQRCNALALSCNEL